MRDGVELSADLYHPREDGRRTAVLARTPYLKNTSEQQLLAQMYAEHGYTFVWMDVRGRGDSDGTFAPWRPRAATATTRSSGSRRSPGPTARVGTWGASYLGCIQWLAALEQPPHLRRDDRARLAVGPLCRGHPTGTHIPWEICWFRISIGARAAAAEAVDWPAVYTGTCRC